MSKPTLTQQCVAEFIGTFLLVFFGCGVVHTAVLTGAQAGLWQVAIVWGVAIMLAIYTVGAISGAHINPAMTIAFAVWRDFPTGRVLPYIGAQLLGAMFAAFCLFNLFQSQLKEKEEALGVRRGQQGSIVTASCYGEYYPAPGNWKPSEKEWKQFQNSVTLPTAWLAEFLGTAILALIVFAVTDPKNQGQPTAGLAPVFIGLTVAVLISVIAPLTQACFNPARDFGPRLFTSWAGWKDVPFGSTPGSGWLTVYILAPIIGAWAGGGLYTRFLQPGMGK